MPTQPSEATQPSEEHGILKDAVPAADVRLSFESGPSQSRGAPEISKEEVDGQRYRPLLRAAFKGDWESAEGFFERYPASRTAKITSRSETVLHVAALSSQDQFFEKLVEFLSPDPKALDLVDCGGRTALHNAVLCGRIRMVKALVERNPRLTQIQDKKGCVPLGISALEGRVPLATAALEASKHKEIAWFLAEKTTDDEPSHPFSRPSAIDFILNLTYAGHLDITLYLVRRYPHLLTKRSAKYNNRSILDVLARMPSHFRSGNRLGVLAALIFKCIPVDLSCKPTDKYSNPGGYAFLLLGIILGPFMILNFKSTF